MLGHCGTEKLQKTANIHGFKIIGNAEICQDCAVAKARQKLSPKSGKEGVKSLEKEFTLTLVL
jgi:hypothetical protein